MEIGDTPKERPRRSPSIRSDSQSNYVVPGASSQMHHPCSMMRLVYTKGTFCIHASSDRIYVRLQGVPHGVHILDVLISLLHDLLGERSEMTHTPWVHWSANHYFERQLQTNLFLRIDSKRLIFLGQHSML